MATATHRRTSVSIFLGIVILILFLVNWIVYAVAVTAFDPSSVTKIWLGCILGALSLSFIVATILGGKYYNWFTRGFYTVSAVWLGCFMYVFQVSLLFTVGAIFGISGPIPAIVLLGAALALTFYGLVHARKIYIKEISIELKNLPQAWKGRTAVWISDMHLGQLRGSAYARKIVDRINTTPHDIVFIGGDLFDGTAAPDLAELVAPLKNLKAPLGVYFITGNHEEFNRPDQFIAAVRSAGIRTLIDEKIVIDGMQILGVDYEHASSPSGFKRILENLTIDTGAPSILLKHQPKDVQVAADAGVSLQISGHTHNGQQWPFGYIASRVHDGFGYGLKKCKEMFVYTSSGVGTWGPPMRVGTDCEIVMFVFK